MPPVCWEGQLCVLCEFVTIDSRCIDFLRSTAFLNTQDVFGNHLDMESDAVAVHWPADEGLEDEKGQGA
jgi:hypothetical protein